MGERELLIWWTNEADWKRVETVIGELDVPNYINEEFRSRSGRNGRGRLWISTHIKNPPSHIPWVNGAPGRIAEDAAGIVIEARDFAFVAALPGFVTTLDLEFPRFSQSVV